MFLQALKKALFKPAAFFKGILIPLCEVRYTFKTFLNNQFKILEFFVLQGTGSWCCKNYSSLELFVLQAMWDLSWCCIILLVWKSLYSIVLYYCMFCCFLVLQDVLISWFRQIFTWQGIVTFQCLCSIVLLLKVPLVLQDVLFSGLEFLVAAYCFVAISRVFLGVLRCIVLWFRLILLHSIVLF